MKKLKNVLNKFLDVLYPKQLKCIFCGDELNEETENETCFNCGQNLPYITNPCSRCGNQLENDDLICLNCKQNNYNFIQARSVFMYQDEIMLAMKKFKYDRVKIYAESFAKYMSRILATWSIEPDIITPVPLHKTRQKQRGYNQAECLAQIISSKFNIKCLNLCEKIEDNISQTNLNFVERSKNVKGVYKFKNEFKHDIKDKIILLVDDVFTTGATTSEISKILVDAGAKEVYVLTFAHTCREYKI